MGPCQKFWAETKWTILQTTTRIFSIPPNHVLIPGRNYEAVVTVKLVDSPYYNQDTAVVEVGISDITVTVVGGDTSGSVQSGFLLDGTQSIDPDDELKVSLNFDHGNPCL